MRLVIADAGPVHYLVLIGHIELLPRLFERVVLPSAVQSELSTRAAPGTVRDWISMPPGWLEIAEAPAVSASIGVHRGEAAAISLALSLHAELLLMDDRRAVRAARSQGLRVTGTLGVLDLAAERGLIDFAQAIHELERTTFRRPVELLNALRAKHEKR